MVRLVTPAIGCTSWRSTTGVRSTARAATSTPFGRPATPPSSSARTAQGNRRSSDALLTLLVRPVVRNYNVAAGGHKQERDERTYIKGAHGRASHDEDNRAEVQFLRASGSHYSALLACFRNEVTDQTFTVALLLYLNSEGRAEKVYCFAPDERSIAADCAGLASTERLRQQMERRGFRATTNYAEYHSWFTRATGVRPKAMDMFNQTVAVKDIQSLNRFIRDHMLEAKPWGEKVDSLLDHFTPVERGPPEPGAHPAAGRTARTHRPRGHDLPRAGWATGAGSAPAGGGRFVLPPEDHRPLLAGVCGPAVGTRGGEEEKGTAWPRPRRGAGGMPPAEERDGTGGRRANAANPLLIQNHEAHRRRRSARRTVAGTERFARQGSQVR